MSDIMDMPQVEHALLINDIRESSEFRGTTFSGYKKAEVKKQLLLNLGNGQIEQSCYWTAEMVCAAHFMDLWEILLFYLGKFIHLANPKLAVYLHKRFMVFRNIIVQGCDEMQLRNNPTIRNMFVEIVAVFCISPKKPALEPIKIKTQEEFDITKITERLKAPSSDFAVPILKKEDPKEITIAINEFCYHISKTDGHIPNMVHACFWLQWIIEFEAMCRKQKRPCLGDTRENIPVEYKYQKEIIWIIWDALLDQCKTDDYITSIVNAILNLFCIKFSPSSIKKRCYLLYFAISITIEPFVRNTTMISNKSIVEHSILQGSAVYKQIKKNEVSPQTDYLFSGLHDPNATQKSLHRFEMVHSIFGDSNNMTTHNSNEND